MKRGEEKRGAPAGTWVLEGSIEIPATFYVYGARINKLRKVIKNADAKQVQKKKQLDNNEAMKKTLHV